MQTDPTATSPRFLGKYEVLARLDSGGMAEIFLARARGVAGFEKLVVLKRILPHLAAEEEFVSLFLDEAKTTVALSHGNIVQVFDMGKGEDGDYFIAMEYVAGKNLRRLIRRRVESSGSPLDPVLSVWIACEVLRGLDYAHRRTDPAGKPLGIVHRDLSPHNVLVSYEGEVKVADFGIAKAAGKVVRTETGLIRGKAAYMSPEQAHGESLDGRSDLFSVGILLYELLTGETPFSADQPQKILDALTRGPAPQPPSSRRRGVPSSLDAIVLKALARDRDERYATADLLLRDLGGFLVSRGAVPGPRDLAAAMTEHFAEEIESERRQLAALPRSPAGTPDSQARVPTLRVGALSGEVSTPGMRFEGSAPPARNARAARLRRYAGPAALVAVPVIGLAFALARSEGGGTGIPSPTASPTASASATSTGAGLGAGSPTPSPSPAPSPSATATPAATATKISVVTPVPTPAEPARPARLGISARPYAYLKIDGRPVVIEGSGNNAEFDGQTWTGTPIESLELEAGRHVIEAFQPWNGSLVKVGERVVRLAPGESQKVLFDDLRMPE